MKILKKSKQFFQSIIMKRRITCFFVIGIKSFLKIHLIKKNEQHAYCDSNVILNVNKVNTIYKKS